MRHDMAEPRLLEGAKIATVYGTTPHYMLETFLHQMSSPGIDLVFVQTNEILPLRKTSASRNSGRKEAPGSPGASIDSKRRCASLG